METRSKSKTTQLYTTKIMQEESSIREVSEQVELEEDHQEVNSTNNDKSDPIHDIFSIIKSLGKNTEKTGRVREPELFNGRDPKKLKFFLLQCRLYSRANSESFRDEAHRVTFALSYLRDVTLEWFEPGLSGLTDEPPTWLEDWDAFIEELHTNFGPHDESGDVENDLVNLRMKDNQRISEYLVQFNSLSICCSWGESALRHRFYKGLPPRLKDDVSRGDGKPKDLAGMHRKAQNSDARYWERAQERSREGNSNPRANQSKTPSNPSTSTSGTNTQLKTPSDGKSSAPSVPKTAPSTPKPDLTSKLDSQGKLMQKERQYWIDHNLCLFCDKDRH